MNDPAKPPPHDPSADEDLSTSLAGHGHLTDDDASSTASTKDSSTEDSSTEASDQKEQSSVLEEIEDSPVRTKNS